MTLVALVGWILAAMFAGLFAISEHFLRDTRRRLHESFDSHEVTLRHLEKSLDARDRTWRMCLGDRTIRKALAGDDLLPPGGGQ